MHTRHFFQLSLTSCDLENDQNLINSFASPNDILDLSNDISVQV